MSGLPNLTVDTKMEIDLVSEKSFDCNSEHKEISPTCNKTLDVLHLTITTLQNTIKILENELSSKNLIIEYLKNDLDSVKNVSAATKKIAPVPDTEEFETIFETVTPKPLILGKHANHRL